MNTKLLFYLIFLTFLGFLTAAVTLPDLEKNIFRTNQDYALFFAVNDYENMDDLQNPIRNANEIAAELENNFGFKVEVVENPSIDEIDQKLDEYEQRFSNGTFGQKGQLFIYFSGHGVSIGDNGYFMTRDADPLRPHRTALDYDFCREKIDNFSCQHIMVVIDACYSATFDPSFGKRSDRYYSRPGEQNFDRLLSNYQTYRSRIFWTSDAKGSETPDRSTFAFQLLEGLRTHQSRRDYLSSKELYTLYLEQAAPGPSGGSFGSDDANSCFLFFRKVHLDIDNIRADQAAYQAALSTNTLDAYRLYLSNFPNGDFHTLVQEKVHAIEAEERELEAWSLAKENNTYLAYATFIRNFPNSVYVPVAKGNMRKTVPSLNKEPHETLVDIIFGDYDFVFVEGGTFTMGCQDGRDEYCGDWDRPSHQVTVSSFFLNKYEVTQVQWREVMGSDPPELYNKYCDQCPVESISFNDIQEFIQKLNDLTGLNYRLPTEAEWEYAARGGKVSKGYKFSGSDMIDEVAWYRGNYKLRNAHGTQETTHAVGERQANELGLFDMTGNVAEWCSDLYSRDYYNNSPRLNPQGLKSGTDRHVIRGGSYGNSSQDCGLVLRVNNGPAGSFNSLGFRLAHSY